MGLAAGFKKFVSATIQSAVLPHEPDCDVILTDAPCILHSFSTGPGDDIPAGIQLYQRLKRAVLYGSSPQATVVVCFDRQEDTPVEKAAAHKKRRQAKRTWTRKDVEDLLQRDELPRGDEWNDLLAARDVRELVAGYLSNKLSRWYAHEGKDAIKRLIIHNGGTAEPVIMEAGVAVDMGDTPRAGEADLALVMWAAWMHAREPTAKAVIRTIDTDIVAIAAAHMTGECTVALTHPLESGQPRRGLLESLIVVRKKKKASSWCLQI